MRVLLFVSVLDSKIEFHLWILLCNFFSWISDQFKIINREIEKICFLCIQNKSWITINCISIKNDFFCLTQMSFINLNVFTYMV